MLKKQIEVMGFFILFFTTSFFSISFFSLGAHALTPGAQKLVILETQFNAAATRSSEPVMMPHYEISLEWVGHDFADRLDSKIRDSLVVQINGQTYIRWILNPEDTKWGKQLQLYFKEKYSFDLEVKYHYIGYQTASRSYIVEDPVSKIQFSVKSSTNNTGGVWQNKKQPVGEAIDSRLVGDFLNSQNRIRPFKNFIVLDEPAILSMAEVDQAVIIRDLKDLNAHQPKHYYIPGFSLLHQEYGQELAKKNGSNEPYKYWTENYIRPVGRALGELAARTGMQLDSPHSQNFLIEFDVNFKPTGRVVLRDLADFYIEENFMRAIEGPNSPFLKKFNQKLIVKKSIQSGFDPLYGNAHPSWVTPQRYAIWLDVFYQEFNQSFKQISGYDPELAMISKPQQDGDRFYAEIDVKQKIGDPFFETLKTYNHFPSQAFLCGQIFN